jgi:hypothetical protein
MTSPMVREKLEMWRFIVTSLDSQTLSLLDNRSTGRRVVFTLNAPAYHEGQVGSDDPEINLPWPLATSPAYLALNTRLIYGFQREPGASPPWVCRFGGIVMSVEDEGADVPTTRYTAYDPWQLLLARPIRDTGTPFAAPGVDGLTFAAGSRASDIAAVLLAATELEDGETHIDFSDDSLIHDTDPLGAAITFDQGTSVGEAWQQLCDTGTLDIVLEPMYEPITAPGKLVRFSTWKPPNALTPEAGGTLRADAVMGWDRAGKSLTGISRLVDGTRLANVVQFYANQTAVPVQTDPASIAAVGQYWAQQFFPGTGNEELVALMAVAELAIRRNGQRSISLDPGPERTDVALRDYGLRDYVPVWSSKRLREPLAIDYAAYDPDIPSGAGYLRIYQIPIEITDDGASLVRGIMTGRDVG